MTLHGLGSAEAAGMLGGVISGTTFEAISPPSTGIVGLPTLEGARAFKVDPVNGISVVQTYGWNVAINSQGNQRLMLTSAIIHIEDFWDEQVSLIELGDGALGGVVRQISIDSNAKLFISDKDGDDFGQTSTGYLATGINYHVLWLYDQRSLADTRDMFWVWKSGAWALAIDVTGHGDGLDTITHLTFGTSSGKGPLPTTGGPFYFVNATAQNLLVAPNGGSTEPKDDAKGSFACKVKMPSANGTYGDFDAGVGAHAHPDYRHVDEIPSNNTGDYDEGNVAGDLQSYVIADADGGEEVLAVQVVGAALQTGLAADLTPRPFIFDGTSRHNLPTYFVGLEPSWTRLNDADEDVTLNQINGADLDETLFNLLEAGLEITQVQNGKVLRVSQMVIEYAIPGSKVLPSDFPRLGPPVIRHRVLIQQVI